MYILYIYIFLIVELNSCSASLICLLDLSVQELMKYNCELFAFIWRSFDIDEQGRDKCHHIYYLQ